jgi:2-keto-4-pentenoate hydratase
MSSSTFAAELMDAERSCAPIAPFTERDASFTVDDAYAVQLEVVGARVSRGEKVVGKKIGLTSEAMQRLLGVGEPDYGHILESMVLPDDACSRDALIQPKVEGEIAFVMEADVRGPGVTTADVLRATAFVRPVIEIVDSRIVDWKIRLPDTVADNASSARVVLGGTKLKVDELDLRLVGMVLERNGEVVNTGSGAAVWGHPAAAVAWLANKLDEFGVWLREGDIVLSGAFTAAADAHKGDTFVAAFDRLGCVSVRFS